MFKNDQDDMDISDDDILKSKEGELSTFYDQLEEEEIEHFQEALYLDDDINQKETDIKSITIQFQGNPDI